MRAQQFQNLRDSVEVIIPDTESLSDAVPLYGTVPVGLITPAEWDAADISFEGSHDGTTFYPLYSQTAEVKIATDIVDAAEARFFALDPNQFRGISHLKVRSGLNGSPVAQSPARTLILIRKPVA